ncbi:MAG: BamA/TamA family outer membrane protein [Deltaproteobacteria bacterium]|nr:BamA/TamA family outer membrane protein [Deltaproteobacteria bacterium]
MFSDAGSVTKDAGSVFGHIQPTAGAGIRARTPVGPVRLDLGYQLTANPPLERFALHFSFGYPF